MQNTINRVGRYFKTLYNKFFRKQVKEQVKLVKTYSYFTFDDYVEYGCSYWTLPTNFEKCKLFDGQLVEVKEGVKVFNSIIKSLINNDKLKNYVDFR